MHSYLNKRYAAEILFKNICFLSIVVSIVFLIIFILNIVIKSYNSFYQPQIKLILNDVCYTAQHQNDYNECIKISLFNQFEHEKYILKTNLLKLISLDADIRLHKTGILPQQREIWIPASSIVGNYLKNREVIQNRQLLYILDKMGQNKIIRLKLNLGIITNNDSREPELAGVFGGLIGSFLIAIVCTIVSVPLGVFSAIYLEELLEKKFLKNLIEININNLAAVPSVVYGLLGLSAFIGVFNLPRSSSLVAGLTLSLLILPVIIVSTRQALKSIPDYIREGALALGASKIQVIFHHILPLAIPNIITGIILGISRAVGETAPLITLGMVAFISKIPKNIFEPSTTMPVLIYTWSDSPESAFVEKTSAAILLLMVLIVSLNYCAIYIRNKYERKW